MSATEGPLTLSLSPKGEGTLWYERAASHLSLWGRGRRAAAGEGAFAHTRSVSP